MGVMYASICARMYVHTCMCACMHALWRACNKQACIHYPPWSLQVYMHLQMSGTPSAHDSCAPLCTSSPLLTGSVRWGAVQKEKAAEEAAASRPPPTQPNATASSAVVQGEQSEDAQGMSEYSPGQVPASGISEGYGQVCARVCEGGRACWVCLWGRVYVSLHAHACTPKF